MEMAQKSGTLLVHSFVGSISIVQSAWGFSSFMAA